MSRVFYDSGVRIVVKETSAGKLMLCIGELEADLTEAVAQRVIDALQRALRDLHSKDPRD